MEFTANIANLGKYNAGGLAAAWLSFPTTTEQAQSVLREIGVDGLRYEEIIILEYSTGVKGLAGKLGEFISIDELNYLANASYIATDPKGELARSAVPLLLQEGYTIRVIDLVDPEHSDCYNPFHYIRNDADVLKLIANFIRNTTPKNAHSNDPFSIIKALGIIILGWGIVQVGMSFQSHDASQRTQGFLCLFGGLMIAFAKEILSVIGVV